MSQVLTDYCPSCVRCDTMRLIHTSLVALLLTACGTSDSPNHAVVRDSAGITIVDNGTMVAPTVWTVSAEPTVNIGAMDGADEYLLNRVAGAFKLGDGRIVIANGGSAEWRFYDAAGMFLKASGGHGGGPGELRALFEVSLLPDDTMVAFDPAARRADWYDDTGVFVRRTQVDVGALVEPPFYTEGSHILSDRSLLVRMYESEPRPHPDGVYRSPLGFVRVTEDLVVRDTLAWVGSLENYLIHIDDRVVPGARPFARRAVETWGGDYVYVADTDRYDIYAYQLSTGAHMRIRREVPPVPVTDADRAEFVESYREFMGRSRRPTANLERWLAAVTYPATKPPIQDLRADRAGWLWVAETGSREDSTVTWSVFDTSGRLHAWVALPVRLTLLDIGDDYILARHRDELNVEFVRVYTLNKE